MQMHIIKKGNQDKTILSDHTLINEEIDRSIKLYNWGFILSFLPSGSFLVGGYIRDLILGRLKSKIDVDIVVPNNSIMIGRKIADNFQGKFIILDERREVVRIIFKHITIDIAVQISPSIETDLLSRDFSINSIAFSFEKKLLIDPLNGIKDMQLSLLRINSPQNLIDDPLRILRCFRFFSELNFKIDEKLIDLLKKYRNQLTLVANERINYEINGIIRGKSAFEAIMLIKKLKIFNYIQSETNLLFVDLEKINFSVLNQFEKEQFLPLFFLFQILDEFSLKELTFSKFEISNIKKLRKWKKKLEKKAIHKFNEKERFDLHKDLEMILPAFILLLPQPFHIDWITRWRDNDNKLFHPSSLINGDLVKNYLEIQDGPLLGKLINYLSRELAFNRLDNFDEAIYKGKQWIKQNAPKCD